MYTCYKQNCNLLASLCSLAGWFESHFVGNPEDRFSRIAAHILSAAFDFFAIFNFTEKRD